MISIITPCFNEGGQIITFLKQFESLKGDFEVIVVDGGSSDNTMSLMEEYDASFTFKFFQVMNAPRAASMNFGAKKALGSIFAFVHSDSILPDSALILIEDSFKEADVIGGAFCLKFVPSTFVYSGISYFGRLRSIFLKKFHGDQGIFINANTFNKLGEYPEIPLMEDVALSDKMSKAGRLVVIRECITASPRRFAANGFWKMLYLYFYLKSLYYLGYDIEYIAKTYNNLKTGK